MYWNGAGSEAAALTMTVYSRAPFSRRVSTDLGHGRGLLADRDVDALDRLVRPQNGFCAMIASSAIAVLPVWRSPMISSALAAADRRHRVDRGDPGVERLLHGLARHDVGRLELQAPALLSDGIDPLSSNGRPKASTTRPRKPSPTGIERIFPVCLHRIALLDREASPRTMQPISSSSRLNASPRSSPGTRAARSPSLVAGRTRGRSRPRTR